MALHYALPVKSDTPEFEIQISKMAMHYAVLVQMCNPSDEMITQTKCKIHIGWPKTACPCEGLAPSGGGQPTSLLTSPLIR